MTLSTPGAIVGLAAASVVAWQLGGALGMGVLMGFFGGASIAMLGAMWIRHALRFNPKRAMRCQLEAFMAKMTVLFMGAIAFRFIESAAARVDWRAFLVSYIAAVLVLMVLGTVDTMRLVKSKNRTFNGNQA